MRTRGSVGQGPFTAKMPPSSHLLIDIVVGVDQERKAVRYEATRPGSEP